MDEYGQMISRQKKWMFYYLAILALGTAVTSYHSIFNGLLLGSAVSFYNLWLLQRKIKKLGEAIVNDTKVFGLGTFVRFGSVAAVVLLAIEFEQYFHFIAVIIGLMTMYLVIMIDGLLFLTRD
ncbi:ATP synthase subunit I [Paraliobacillus sediminis]|uniref:ATP synthase subunit I n=1 Tax=Paraliobacillus sediminis TaxID=1885916 RepID=UPI000E3BFC26|nr:ATP synthase subunit I [Paraliobacillus sediminis]